MKTIALATVKKVFQIWCVVPVILGMVASYLFGSKVGSAIGSVCWVGDCFFPGPICSGPILALLAPLALIKGIYSLATYNPLDCF